jgi:ribosomal protein L37E
MKPGPKRVAICPKCGHAGASFLPSGKKQCNECGFIGRTPLFRRGGPKPKHQLDMPKADCIELEKGALWQRPIPYGDD